MVDPVGKILGNQYENDFKVGDKLVGIKSFNRNAKAVVRQVYGPGHYEAKIQWAEKSSRHLGGYHEINGVDWEKVR